MTDFMKFSKANIAEAIRDLGYKGKELVDANVSFIESAASGRSFFVYPHLPDGEFVSAESAEASLVRFRAYWPQMDDLGEAQADALCNWFNADQSFTKLFRRTSQTSFGLILEADLYVLDGMSMAAFQNRTEAFITSYEYAMKCLERCTYIDKDEILERHNKAVEILHGAGEDLSEAVKLYRINSHLGYAGSQNNFGDLFEIGEHVEKDELLEKVRVRLLFNRYNYSSVQQFISIISSFLLLKRFAIQLFTLMGIGLTILILAPD